MSIESWNGRLDRTEFVNADTEFASTRVWLNIRVREAGIEIGDTLWNLEIFRV